jgi:hypothetical protein
MIIAELTGAAQRYARWDEPGEATTAAAVAELREIAGDRADLLAEVAGVQLGTKEGTPDEPRARNAAAFCRAAGADEALIPQWVEEGRQRARTSPQAALRYGVRPGSPLALA